MPAIVELATRLSQEQEIQELLRDKDVSKSLPLLFTKILPHVLPIVKTILEDLAEQRNTSMESTAHKTIFCEGKAFDVEFCYPDPSIIQVLHVA